MSKIKSDAVEAYELDLSPMYSGPTVAERIQQITKELERLQKIEGKEKKIEYPFVDLLTAFLLAGAPTNGREYLRHIRLAEKIEAAEEGGMVLLSEEEKKLLVAVFEEIPQGFRLGKQEREPVQRVLEGLKLIQAKKTIDEENDDLEDEDFEEEIPVRKSKKPKLNGAARVGV